MFGKATPRPAFPNIILVVPIFVGALRVQKWVFEVRTNLENTHNNKAHAKTSPLPFFKDLKDL